jgi:hypothetical protein
MTRMVLMARRGKWTGGTAPYGYRLEPFGEPGKKLDPCDKRLVPGEPQHVAAVRLIFDLFGNKGWSFDRIARELRARGVPDPRGNREWRKPSIRFILRNKKYVGDLVWNRVAHGKYSDLKDGQVRAHDQRQRRRQNGEADWIIIPDVHEPLIDRDLFERVQARLAENKRSNVHVPAGRTHPLTGLLVCAECGWHMIGGTTKSGSRFYYCGCYHALGGTKCHYNRVAEGRLLPCLVRKVQEFALNPEVLDRLRDEIRRRIDDADRRRPARLAAPRKKVAKLDQDIAKGKRNMALADDADSIKAIGQTVREWQTEREQVTEEIGRLERRADQAEDEKVLKECEAHLWHLQDAFASSDPADVRDVLREMVSKVELWFTHRRTAKQTRNTFARGRVYLRLDRRLLAGGEGGGNGTSSLTEMYTGKRGTPASDSSW